MTINSSTRQPAAGKGARLRAAMLAAGLGLGMALTPLATMPYASAQALSAGSNLVQMPSLAPIIKKVLPAVVNISVVEKAGTGETSDEEDASPGQFQQGSPFDEFLRKFFEDQGINPENGNRL